MYLTWLGCLTANPNHLGSPYNYTRSVPCLDHVCNQERLLFLFIHENLNPEGGREGGRGGKGEREGGGEIVFICEYVSVVCVYVCEVYVWYVWSVMYVYVVYVYM